MGGPTNNANKGAADGSERIERILALLMGATLNPKTGLVNPKTGLLREIFLGLGPSLAESV